MLDHWFYYLDFPASWFEMKAVLIPKFVGAYQLGRLRAIAVWSQCASLWVSEGCLYCHQLCIIPLRMVLCQIRLHRRVFLCYVVRPSFRENGIANYMWCKLIFARHFKGLPQGSHPGAEVARCELTVCGNILQVPFVYDTAAGLGQCGIGQLRHRPTFGRRGSRVPKVFTLVTEMVLRPLLQKWRAKRWGWHLDEF